MIAPRIATVVVGSAAATLAASMTRDSHHAPTTMARADYVWSPVTPAAAFEGSYNFPVFVVRGEMWAFHPRGTWTSRDGRTWTPTPLPSSGLNTGYQKYVALGDAVYALGTMSGNYLDLHLTSKIARTRDLRRWEVVAAQSNLPPRVFYGAVVHGGKIWLMGGFDGRAYFNDVWSSPDAVHWTRVLEHAPWSARNVDMAVDFRGEMWVIGGGVIDGQPEPNPNARREVWSSADGIRWVRHRDRSGSAWGGSPVVYDDQLWLIAANRNSTFAPSLLVTSDGESWREQAAPWSARGAPAVWVFDDKLFMAGGKYSVTENGAQRFIYRNDVWSMARK
jgi:hypothetical protein